MLTRGLGNDAGETIRLFEYVTCLIRQHGPCGVRLAWVRVLRSRAAPEFTPDFRAYFSSSLRSIMSSRQGGKLKPLKVRPLHVARDNIANTRLKAPKKDKREEDEEDLGFGNSKPKPKPQTLNEDADGSETKKTADAVPQRPGMFVSCY